MRIAVWKTGHSIADTVADAVAEGLNGVFYSTTETFSNDFSGPLPEADIHIAYGILRGTAEVFRKAQAAGKPWFNIDRGYWKPGHYDGYYRISLRGTQQTTGLDKLEPDYERWDRLGLDVKEPKEQLGLGLICPPTDYVCDFYGIKPWIDHGFKLWRDKDCRRLLQDDLEKADEVYTFNSSIGWEALRQGIPVISDPDHSIIGAWQKQFDKENLLDLDRRLKLFSVMASLQLTLSEIRSGFLWPLLERLLTNQPKK